ncbi:CsbD family protein [Paraglaciecola hydrolytica]|uniref:General stress protein CsbD n=1 Tax=Paraglaciecola hydrolytica TaxID=1799789 RepID=A0A148KMH8_9ALTE|nr:CsbD family protein [Paraglaciecola hydrolytica]KXI27481.1 general stress protein CsbD [Paraglaciecola hydrolytica]
MNKDIAKGKWNQLSGSIQEKWGELTNDEITEMDGKFDKFYGKMQERYGMSKEEAQKAFYGLSQPLR